MSRKPLKTIVFISLGMLVVLIFGFFGARRVQTAASTQPRHETFTETTLPVSPRVFHKSLSTPQKSPTDFQKTDFYRTIVDNNLFRPLGWRPPRPREPYRLIGTLLPTDGKSEAQAILQGTTAGRTYTVSLGETLDTDTILVDIQPKQVTLEKAGVRRTLHLNATSLLK